MRRFIFVLVILFFGICSNLHASVVIVIDTEKGFSVAKNYDSKGMVGYLIVNPRGMRHNAMSVLYSNYSWVSKYGSVTFNQLSKNLPIGGINEKGLIVEMIEAEEMSERQDDCFVELNEYEVVKFLLDRCENVKDAVDLLRDVKADSFFGMSHYFLVDQSGESAVVEFLEEGILVYDKFYVNYYPMLSKGVYKRSINRILGDKSRVNLGDEIFSKMHLERKGEGSMNRAKIFSFLDQFKTKDNVWSIVYEDEKVFFKSKASPMVKYIDLSEIDFDGEKQLYIDANRLLEQKCNNFLEELDDVAHRNLVKNSFKSFEIDGFGDQAQESLIVNDTEKLHDFLVERKANYKTLKVKVSNLDSDKGVLRVFLYDSAEGFEEARSYRSAMVQVSDEAGEAYFYNIPADKEYAIYYYHDENSNNRVDRQWVGLPLEDTGYSGRGRGDFDDMKIKYSDLTNGSYSIKNRSFLFW